MSQGLPQANQQRFDNLGISRQVVAQANTESLLQGLPQANQRRFDSPGILRQVVASANTGSLLNRVQASGISRSAKDLPQEVCAFDSAARLLAQTWVQAFGISRSAKDLPPTVCARDSAPRSPKANVGSSAGSRPGGDPSERSMRKKVVAMAGQSLDLSPALRRLYGLRARPGEVEHPRRFALRVSAGRTDA